MQIAAVASGRRMVTQNDDEEILYRNSESAVRSIFKARLSPYTKRNETNLNENTASTKGFIVVSSPIEIFTLFKVMFFNIYI